MSDTNTLYNALGITRTTPASFLDINLAKDTRLFIDPMNILRNSDPLSLEAKDIIQDYFVLLIEYISKWDEAKALHLLSGLTESNTISSFTRLGYATRKNWKAIWPDKAKMLYDAIKASWAKDLGWIEDITFMIMWIDKDNISDLITNLIGRLLADYSLKECVRYWWASKIRRKVLMWSPAEMDWIKKDVEIPFLKDEYIIFMPKNLVAKNFLLSTANLLTHVIVPYEQERHFNAWGALCRLLKDGSKWKPLVKDIRQLIDCTKSQVIAFIRANPSLLEKYKESLIVG
jgi:hypothetical protein